MRPFGIKEKEKSADEVFIQFNGFSKTKLITNEIDIHGLVLRFQQ